MRDDVAAGARLAHGERADVLAGDQLGQVLLLLRVGAVALDLVHAQVASARRRTGPPRREAREISSIAIMCAR